tara:strand:- start:3531 stop:3671 length:141 start_codon:yes stop_codon:yes gene_type:complete
MEMSVRELNAVVPLTGRLMVPVAGRRLARQARLSMHGKAIKDARSA